MKHINNNLHNTSLKYNTTIIVLTFEVHHYNCTSAASEKECIVGRTSLLSYCVKQTLLLISLYVQLL